MRVAVLGAGLQGSCVAMELASQGIKVDLYDRGAACMTQASAHNEGKIHLGYVYANDRTRKTARLMVQGAVCFAPLLRQWVGSAIDNIPVSTPFHYAVHRDSLLSVEEVQEHLQACHALARAEHPGPADYFGQDYHRPPSRLDHHEDLFDPRTTAAVFTTAEVSIQPEALARCVRARLAADPGIRCRLLTHVLRVAPAASHVEVECESRGERFRECYDHVVNTLWSGRLAVDASAGLCPARPWLYRVKYYLRGRLSRPGLSPSVTLVLGAFGDVVHYPDGALDLSWYPVGMRGSSMALSPPDWPTHLEGEEAQETIRGIHAGLTRILPVLEDLPAEYLSTCAVQGGIIVAWGATDIHEPGSELHSRADIGPHSFGRYHTVNTGKLTMAPLFARRLANCIRRG